MSLAVQLIPWTQLTRFGVPDPTEFRVIRRPMEIGGVGIVQPGETLPPDAITNRVRLRQLYEQRRIEPVAIPEGISMVSRARARMEQAMAERTPAPPLPSVDYSRVAGGPALPFVPDAVMISESAETDVKAKVKPTFKRVTPAPPRRP
jgi:hypothetical protein